MGTRTSLRLYYAIDQLQYARINKNPVLFKDHFRKDESFNVITDTAAHYFYHATKNQHRKRCFAFFTFDLKTSGDSKSVG